MSKESKHQVVSYQLHSTVITENSYGVKGLYLICFTVQFLFINALY